MTESKSKAIPQERPLKRRLSVLRFLDLITVQLRRIIRFAALAAGFLVLAMTLFMSFDVLMRYGGGRATAVADEITAFLLVGITFLGAGSTELANRHINVESFVGFLKPRQRNMVRLVTLLLALGYVVFLTWQVFPYIATSKRLLYRTAGLMRFPLWIPQTFIPIGLVALILALLVNIIETAMELMGHRPSGREG